MEPINFPLILVIISSLLILGLLFIILKIKSKNQLQKIFVYDLLCVLIISVGVIFQEIFMKRLHGDPMVFEYFIYIGTCFLPVSIYFTGIIFSKTKIKFTPKYLLLFIVPIITLFILWTNNYHHLFYKHYSTNLSECIYGPYLLIHNIYTYSLIFLGLMHLIRFSVKNSGLFSRQSVLIIVGISVPVLVNLLGVLKILPLTVYATPIAFTITMIFCALAIFKFNFLGATPIALQKIVDRISDSYIVLDEDKKISDFNKTLLTMFKLKSSDIREVDFETFLKKNKLSVSKFKNAIEKTKDNNKTVSFQYNVAKIHKTFTVEVNTISSDEASLGTLILFKDITQHIEDMQTIKDNQELLMERERLSSLGQLIGGIAHNLKTPIMSISGAAEGLSDLIKEYDSSIDDPEVNSQDHHDIAHDMSEWIVKIKEYTEYMSDIITAVKGQAVTLSETDNISFDIDELVKRVDILMKHELKNAFITMNIYMNAPKTTKINGDINSLVQVINNMVSNAIQSYNGTPEQSIDLILEKKNNNLIISVKDYGSGLPKKVKDKLFKEMITTKGKNGTGLGLYMSYSTIKAHFNGEITFESEEGKGTRFDIILPL